MSACGVVRESNNGLVESSPVIAFFLYTIVHVYFNGRRVLKCDGNDIVEYMDRSPRGYLNAGAKG